MELKVLKSSKDIADLVSNEFINLIKEKPNAVIGLATGSTPIETYEAIINKAKKEMIDFSSIQSFNLDEYLNNQDFSQSYRYFMDSHLFDYINIKKENTHFPSEENYKNYDDEIKKAGGIDIQLLGIGANGHIGFNEPGTSFDSKTHITQLKEKTIHDNARFFKDISLVPTSAVSMGINTILNSKRIILIALGKNKAQAIYDTFNKYDVSCPASSLSKHNNVTIYCDEEAASLLKKELVHE